MGNHIGYSMKYYTSYQKRERKKGISSVEYAGVVFNSILHIRFADHKIKIFFKSVFQALLQIKFIPLKTTLLHALFWQ